MIHCTSIIVIPITVGICIIVMRMIVSSGTRTCSGTRSCASIHTSSNTCSPTSSGSSSSSSTNGSNGIQRCSSGIHDTTTITINFLIIVLLSPQFQLEPSVIPLTLFHPIRQRSGRLLPIIHHNAMSQIKKMPRITLHHTPHLLRPQGRFGRGTLPLAPMLPPGPQCGEA